jgi:hypothetical protein
VVAFRRVARAGGVTAVVAIVAVFGLIALLVGWSRWLVGRRWAAAGNLALGLALLACFIWAVPVVEALGRYAPLPPGGALADVFLERVGAGRYRVTLTRFPYGRMQVFEVDGDEWRLDARRLDWSDHALALGLGPRVGLEELQSRPAASDGAGSTFVLGSPPGRASSAPPEGWPLWQRSVVVAQSATDWQPMSDGARYSVRLEGTVLRVEAANDAALETLAQGRTAAR